MWPRDSKREGEVGTVILRLLLHRAPGLVEVLEHRELSQRYVCELILAFLPVYG